MPRGTFAYAIALGAVALAVAARGEAVLQHAPPGDQPSSGAVFHSGTRLVEVEVVVRGKRARPRELGAWVKWIFDSGPPWGPPGDPLRGLTKDDFTLLDAGKPQPIAIFSIGPRSEGQPMTIPSGAASNRITDRSQPAGSTTVVLVDFLNSGWIDSEYLRVGVKNLLKALGPNDRIVVYTLGMKLHVLTGFSGPEAKSALQDHGDPPTAFVDPREHPVMTVNALNTITRNLSGVAGRKNLVWAGGHPSNALIAALQQQDIVVYPVRVRSAGIIDTDMPSGGRMFLDAMDLTFAVRTAEEDSGAVYVLGYYPPEEMLDGKYHAIKVKLNDAEVRKQNPEVHYRAGYLATKMAALPAASSLADVLNSPLEATGIGLAAQAIPQAQDPRIYDVRVTIDLRDLHLDRTDGQFVGAFDYAVQDPSSPRAFKTSSVALRMTDRQFARTLETGLILVVKGLEPTSDQIRIAVRDSATGVAGSIRVPTGQR